MTARDRQSAEASRRLIGVSLAASGLAAGCGMAILVGDDQRVIAIAACSFATLAAALWIAAVAASRRASAETPQPARALAPVAPARAAPMSAPEPAPAPAPVRQFSPDDIQSPVDGAVVDEAVLESLRTLGGEAFVGEVVSQFISEGVLCLLKVAQAIGEGDVNEYAAQIHALRSSAANVGARRLYKLCLEWRALSIEDLEASGSARFILLQKEFVAAEAILKGRNAKAGGVAGAMAATAEAV